MKAIEVGSRVMFSAKFLRSIGTYTGKLPFQQGTVVQMSTFGQARHTPATALVQWDHGGTSRSLLVNLIRVDQRHLELP